MITNQQLDAIDARASAATTGPWGLAVDNNEHMIYTLDKTAERWVSLVGSCLCPEDTRFIIAARTDVPALVAEIRRHRTQRFPSYMTACPHCNNGGPETGCDDCLLAQNVELKVKVIELEGIIETMQSSIDLIHTREEPND